METRILKEVRENWDAIAKPIDSLGMLEDYVGKLCNIYGSPLPPDISRRALVILCGDHGVVEEGVTQTGQEVTRIVAENFVKGCSTVNIMARQAKVDVYTIDAGMNTKPYPEKRLQKGVVVNRKVGAGTGNILKEAAMSKEDCELAIEYGKNLVRELKSMGYRILATGEMGIGNTTPTSVLAARLLNLSPKMVTGKGAGLSIEGIEKKCRVVEDTLKRVESITDVRQLLANVGGYEIAMMVGLYLGGMEERIPIVMDGAISVVAGLTAYYMEESVVDFMIPSHVSLEPACRYALERMNLEGMIQGRMCLGEGTGAMTLFPLLDMAVAVYQEMGTFMDYDILPYSRFKEDN